uniref:Uncharacterized protein n=1 Tax=Zea mays TaxID=4577 RepID=C4J8B3_MAIZE|nr:unknown [Zea mays]
MLSIPMMSYSYVQLALLPLECYLRFGFLACVRACVLPAAEQPLSDDAGL